MRPIDDIQRQAVDLLPEKWYNAFEILLDRSLVSARRIEGRSVTARGRTQFAPTMFAVGQI